jgi:hypothetical protein
MITLDTSKDQTHTYLIFTQDGVSQIAQCECGGLDLRMSKNPDGTQLGHCVECGLLRVHGDIKDFGGQI